MSTNSDSFTLRSILISVLQRLKSLFACFGLLMALIALVPPTWYGRWLSLPWSDVQAPVLIVLGGDLVGDNMMGEASYWRSVHAVNIWREGFLKHIVLTGDPPTTTAMRAWFVDQGVPAEAISIESGSHTTRENALFTAALLRNLPGPYLLLSSDTHMWRAQRAFRKAGVAVYPRPAPDAFKRANDWRNRWRVFLDIAEECVKIVYYESRGWI